jgi:hypothetical protein
VRADPMCQSRAQDDHDDDSMTMCLSNLQDDDSMKTCLSNSQDADSNESNDSTPMCLSNSQDDDSMMLVSIENHGIIRVKGACDSSYDPC